MDLGDWIYLLMGLGFLLFSSLAKKKKPDATESSPSQTPKPEFGGWAEILGDDPDIWGKTENEFDEPTKPAKVEQYKPDYETIEQYYEEKSPAYTPIDTIAENVFKPVSYLDTPIGIESQESEIEKTDISKSSIWLDNEEVERDQNEFLKELKENFDGRKALIYAEIFQTRYQSPYR